MSLSLGCQPSFARTSMKPFSKSREARKLLGPEVTPLKAIAPEAMAPPKEAKTRTSSKHGEAHVSNVDADLARLIDAGVVVPGPNWPEGKGVTRGPQKEKAPPEAPKRASRIQ